MFFINARSRREGLNFYLPPKTLLHEGIPLSITWLGVASPSVLPLSLGTSSYMGSSSPSPATPHVNWIFISERYITLPLGVVVDGEVRADPDPVTTTPCSAAEKSWTVDF